MRAGVPSGSWTFNLQTKLKRQSNYGYFFGVNQDHSRAFFLAGKEWQTIRITNQLTDRLLREFNLTKPLESYSLCTLSPNGELMASRITKRQHPKLQIWTLTDGTLKMSLDAQEILGEGAWFSSHSEFSPDAKRIVTRCGVEQSNPYLLWNLETNQFIALFETTSSGRGQRTKGSARIDRKL